MTEGEVREIIKKHQQWLQEGSKLCSDLKADLRGANLTGFNLADVNLSGANLAGANLTYADFRDADFSGANLSNARLVGAYLCNANFCGADLTNASVYEADLESANLFGADLFCAKFNGANLRGANLKSAFTDGTDFCGACFVGAINRPFIPMACPTHGAFTGFKKVRGEYIVQLEIPADARRCSATSRKCRCDKARVIAILDRSGNPVDVKSAFSYHSPTFEYRVGKEVFVPDFNEDRWSECSAGIHFFIDFEEAVQY